MQAPYSYKMGKTEARESLKKWRKRVRSLNGATEANEVTCPAIHERGPLVPLVKKP